MGLDGILIIIFRLCSVRSRQSNGSNLIGRSLHALGNYVSQRVASVSSVELQRSRIIRTNANFTRGQCLERNDGNQHHCHQHEGEQLLTYCFHCF